MSSLYRYPFSDFQNNTVNAGRLTREIQADAYIITALDYINVINSQLYCDIIFKADLSSGEETALSGVISVHSGDPLVDEPPTMADGRPLVRADTRPLDTQTYFTMAGDTASGIGHGKQVKWDFYNNDDLYDPDDTENGPEIPDGYKAKRLDLFFTDPIYIKDGTLYFFDAPWGNYCSMYITIPAGNYYPNNAGSIPAAALGLSGSQMYAYAAKDVFYTCYVCCHHMHGDCPMGDELNAEGAAVDALPVGWRITGIIFTPDDDNVSKGYGSFEMYRGRTILLPGETV